MLFCILILVYIIYFSLFPFFNENLSLFLNFVSTECLKDVVRKIFCIERHFKVKSCLYALQ